MKILILILFSFNLFASEQDEAISHIQKAILTYPKIKKMKKIAESKIQSYIPLEKETIGIVGGIVISTTKGKFDTKSIKKMDFYIVDVNIRPDVQYNLKTGETTGLVNLNLDF